MKFTRLYTPKMTLKEVVTELAIMLGDTNPGYQEPIKDLIEEMELWGTPKKPTPVDPAKGGVEEGNEV